MPNVLRGRIAVRLIALLSAALALYLILTSLPNPTSITIEDSDFKFVSGQLIRFDMRATTLVALSMMMAVLILALQRRDRIISLQKQILVNQQNRISSIDEIIDSHATVCETDQNGIIININNKFSELFEYQKKEIIGKNEALLYEKGRAEESLVSKNEQMKKNNIWIGEERVRTKSGRILHVQSTVIPSLDSNGEQRSNFILRTDQTEKKRNEAGKYLAALLKNLQEEVYIYDAEDLSISYMNDLALKRANWSAKEASEKKIYEISPEFNIELFKSHVKPIIEGEKISVSIEIKSGGHYFEIGTRLFVGPDGIPVFVSISRNITQRKNAENQRLASVSTVSHELRAPLTSIHGSLKLIKSGAVGELAPKLASMIDIATRNSNRMLLVVNDILDLEKIKSGKMDFNFSSIDLRAVVDDSVKANLSYGEMHDVGIVFVCPESEHQIFGDGTRLAQVMTNLITNAVKYSTPGSCIEVDISSYDACFRVSVKDHGPGISNENIPKVFESFCQIEAPDGKKREGTGLGLAISKEIIMAHSGRIDCVSELGSGSTFYFDIPIESKSRVFERTTATSANQARAPF